MPLPGAKPAAFGFVRFKPQALGAGVELLHKVPFGNVDLQFAAMAARAAQFSAQYSAFLDSSMEIALANKSLVVRVSVAAGDGRGAVPTIRAYRPRLSARCGLFARVV